MKKLFAFICLLISLLLVFGGCSKVTNKNEISFEKEDAEKLCAEVLGDYAEETGFPISYKCIDKKTVDGKEYYVMHITWLVDNMHQSYIGNAFVSTDGEEIYDGIVSGDEFEITSLRWKK